MVHMTSNTSDVEVLARSTSIKDEIEILKKGTELHKIRNKGVRGVKDFKRRYRLDIPDLKITYTPNKGGGNSKSCIGGDSDTFIEIAEIAEIRAGHNTDTFNRCVKLAGGVGNVGKDTTVTPKIEELSLPREHCFSLVFKETHKSLDLVAEDQTVRDMWVDVLTHLVVTIRSLGQQKEYEMFLKKQFQNADKNKNGSLNFEECRQLIGQLNVKMEKEELQILFANANKNPAKGREDEALDQGEFVAFYYSLMKRPELEEVFLQYAKNHEHVRMTVEDLIQFQKEEQKMEMLPEECEKIIQAFEPQGGQTTMSMEGFTHFMMFSELQDIVDTQNKSLVYQDMTQPLSHYWMASSHNTYLVGNQVTGESSVDAYINALKNGCRCVEMDCWDGDEGEPIIYHGWTLTSKLLFKEVLTDAILPYAFHTTEYPLILSIENHCSIEQQDKMAHHLTDILKDLLCVVHVDEKELSLPSPESLKKKILVKGKKLPPGKSQDDEVIEEDEDEVEDDERDEAKKKLPVHKISQKLSDIVNHIEAVHFHSFDASASSGKHYHMSSFGEGKASKLSEDPKKAKDFVRYNMRQLSRIYPGGKRQDSSNLQPEKYWNAGCQIVAINYQTDDKSNLYNRAQFSNNGGCGFVLKPEFLRNPDIPYSPCSPSGIPQKRFPHWRVQIHVMSGQHIPRPSGRDNGEIIDPYVKVKIRGHPDDNSSDNAGKTEHVRNNGFNPVWKSGKFVFLVTVPQLAFLELTVKDHSTTGKDAVIGAFCCPLKMVQEGYRRAELEDYAGKKLSPASLLLKIKITEEE